MGTGARYQRAALGQTRGESLGIQEHEKAMIPIMQEQAEVDLGIQGLAFAQQLEQTEALYLLAKRFEDQGQQPVFVPRSPAAKPPSAAQTSNYMLYIGLAVLAWYLWKGI